MVLTWPGASAGDMDRYVGHAADIALNGLQDVRDVRTTSYAGKTYIRVRFLDHADMQQGLSEVQGTLATITSFPEDMEPPKVTLATPNEQVSRILVTGPFSDSTKQSLADHVLNRLRAEGVSDVKVIGNAPRNIYVDVDPILSRAFGLELNSIAQAVSAAIRDVPGGRLETASTDVQTRTVALIKDAYELGNIALKSDVKTVFLRDIASVQERSQDNRVELIYPGGNGFTINARRNLNEDVLEISDKLKKVVAELKTELPGSIDIRQYDVRSISIEKRLNLLIRNLLAGLACVGLVLFVFLNFRAAFWVMVGIPTAFFLSFVFMWGTGQTFNLISVFAMLMIVGIVVDDAIVVAENISLRQKTGSAFQAAADGAIFMLLPVTTATLTTIAAFAPIFFLTDVFGKWVQAIPMFVCVALPASLLECFFLLPGHMRGNFAAAKNASPIDGPQPLNRFRSLIDAAFSRFTEGPFATLVRGLYRLRYLSFLLVLSLIGTAAILAYSNSVKFQFWLRPASNFLFANLTMVEGTKWDVTERAVRSIWQALEKTERDLGYQSGQLAKVTLGLSRTHFNERSKPPGDNRAGVIVELVDGDERNVSSDSFVETWRNNAPKIAGIQSLEITRHGAGPDGADVDVRFSGFDIRSIQAAINALEIKLDAMRGLSNVRNTLNYARSEIQFQVTEAGKQQGFTSGIIGKQLSAAITGIKVQRIALENGFADIYVRHKAAYTVEDSLTYFNLTAPDGTDAYFFQVASLTHAPGEGSVQRTGGKLRASVKADINWTAADGQLIWRALETEILPEIAAAHSVGFKLEGKREEQGRAIDEIVGALVIALITIYFILAWSTSSYALAFAIILVLPIGVAGAVFGHFVMDYKMTMLSLVACVALLGILVNDSIILFSEITNRRAQGLDWEEATVAGYCARLRPVFLTTLTTVVGLAPLIAETSRQAQFLIPVAITITWGLTAATIVSFALIPATIAISQDFWRLGALTRSVDIKLKD